jgi:hypothetical protein
VWKAVLPTIATPMRNCVQVVPLLVAIGVLARRPSWTWPITVPLFSIWAFGMVQLWSRWQSSRLGVSDFSVTSAEVALVALIAMACGTGLVCAIRVPSPVGLRTRAVLLVSAAFVQAAALVLGTLLQDYLAGA